MNIAITGGTGFIGTHLVPALVSRGDIVVVLTEPGQQGSALGARRIPADVTTGAGLEEGMKGVDGVIHLAARNHVLMETAKDPLAAYRRVNVEGTERVVRAAVRSGARWFVHFSSVKAIGEGGDVIFNEISPAIPSTAYGISKLESEEVVRAETAAGGIRGIILRLPMVYGPGNKGNMPRMIRWADRGLPFPLFEPDNFRSMVYIGNLVAGIVMIPKASGPRMTTYILKDGEDYSTRKIYSTICRELGTTPRFVPIPAVVGKLAGSISGDFRKVTGSFRVSSAKIEREIGFFPPYSPEDGIAATVKWYKRSVH